MWVGTLNITMVVQCADRKYYGRSERGAATLPLVFDFLRRNRGRKLRDVIDKEMDFPETVH